MVYYDNNCPRCHGPDVEYNAFKKQYECHDTACGNVWTDWSDGPIRVSEAGAFMRVSIQPGGCSDGETSGWMPHEAKRRRQLSGR